MTAGFARDPALPTRDVLLDPERMPAILGRLMGARGPVDVEDYRPDRPKYRIGESLRMLHRFTVDGEPVVVGSRTYASGARVPHAAIDAHAGRMVGPLRAAAFEPALATAFWTFPVDRKLDHLPELVAGGDAVAAAAGEPLQTQIVQYVPEMSATAAGRRSGQPEPVAFVKAYRDHGQGDRDAVVHAELPGLVERHCDHLAVPRMLGYDRGRRFIGLAAAVGTRLDLIPVTAREDPMRRLGRATAELHALAPPAGVPRFSRLDPDKLVRAAELVTRVRPDVGPAVRSLARALVRGPVAPSGPPSCLHGDMHLRNAFLDGDRVMLIDFEEAGAGDPAAEIGSFRAALRFTAVAGRVDRGTTDALERAFLDGYASVRPLPPEDALQWHLAAALLAERALRVVNRIRLDGLAELSRLLDEARAALAAVAA